MYNVILYWEICNDDITFKNIFFLLHLLGISGDLGPDRGAVRGLVQTPEPDINQSEACIITTDQSDNIFSPVMYL